ncbi:unnamed protein product [Gordionus sp. m RMFG-2023]
MLVIVLNCITLGMYQPCNDAICESRRCKILMLFDHFIFAFFAVELVIKMIAMGIYGKNTYLAESWNRLDLFIVMAGLIEYASNTDSINLSAIRTIRVLRPLRAINRIPSMRILVMLLLDTLPMLGNVMLLCFFVFFIFGIIGVQLWAGMLRNRCFLKLPPNISLPIGSIFPKFYQTDVQNFGDFICTLSGGHGMKHCYEIPKYRYDDKECSATATLFPDHISSNSSCINWNQYYSKCKPSNQNPYHGALSFDNIGLAWIAIFLVISLEGWTDIMYYIQDAHSFWDWLYFVLLIVLGSFFMINLCLVVIATQFSETKRREMEKMKIERKQNRSLSTLTMASNSEPKSCYAEILKYLAHLYRKSKRKFIRVFKNFRNRRYARMLQRQHITEVQKQYLISRINASDDNEDKKINDNTNDKYHLQVYKLNAPVASPEPSDIEGKYSPRVSQALGPSSYLNTPKSNVTVKFIDINQSTKESETCCHNFKNGFLSVQKTIRYFVDSKLFQRGILFAILINTLSMGIEYHNQPKELTKILEYSNFVFTVLFAIEMILKLSAYGIYDYIKIGFNIFDGFIVILSVIELTQSGDSGLSVLRTFRLLRILKLIRFMPALQRQLLVMLKIMDNVATFFMLLILFIFIFSILGMNLFGCKFCKYVEDGKKICDRKNFDSLLWSLVTVFQILTQEDWNVVLFNGMNETSQWAALYFIALMTFGNYVLFNLLVAILVEGFQGDERSLSGDSNKSSAYKPVTPNGIKYLDVMRDYNRPLSLPKFQLNDPNTKYVFIEVQNPGILAPLITHTAATPQTSPKIENIRLQFKRQNMVSSQTLNKSISYDSIYSGSNRFKPYIRTETKIPLVKIQSLIPGKDLGSQNFSHQSSNSILPNSYSNFSSIGDDDIHSSKDYPLFASNRKQAFSPNFDSSLGLKKSHQRYSYRSLKHSTSPNILRRHSTCPNRYSVLRVQVQDVNKGDNIIDHVPKSNFLMVPTTRARGKNISRDHLAPPSMTLRRSSQSLSKQDENNLKFKSISEFVNPPNQVNKCNLDFKDQSNKEKTTLYFEPIVASKQYLVEPFNPLPSSLNLPLYDVEMYFRNKRRSYQLNLDEKPDKKPRVGDRLSLPIIHYKSKDERKIIHQFCPSWLHNFKRKRKDYSLYIFGPKNQLRQICSRYVENKWFDYMVLLFISLNCITLAMERPNIPPYSMERKFLTSSNYVFSIIYGIEMILKIISDGLLVGKRAYFQIGWNIMDGSLVIISLIDIILTFTSIKSPKIFGMLRVLRLLRTLRPLRVINRAPGLKLVVQTLLSSLRPIGNIVLICCTFFIIFGILGVQLFKGTFYHCEGDDTDSVKNKSDCLRDSKNKWKNAKYNFDNLGQALMSLFVLSSKDGWVNIMYNGLDAVGLDQQPIVNFSEWRLLYFISFLLLVGFFVLNMFVGVVVENFHKCREDLDREEQATRLVKRMKKLEARRKSIRQVPVHFEYSKTRRFLHNIVTSKYFDLAIAAVIGLNVVSMALEFYNMPLELIYALKIFNYFFTAVFIIESTMKLIALGVKSYMSDRWNQLDIIIVILSIFGIILEEMKSNIFPINPTIIRVMRVLRIARVLKLLKMAKGIRALLDTVVQALPQVGNLGLLFFLLFFIFAALGVELFGKLECSIEHPCDGLSEHAHFKDFGMAFLTLFRIATGDNWNGIMKDTLREDCDSSSDCLKNCCASQILSPIFFVIFVLMAQFVLVNVVVAVLMKHLEESNKQVRYEDDIDDELQKQIEKEEKNLESRDIISPLGFTPHSTSLENLDLIGETNFNDDTISEGYPNVTMHLMNEEENATNAPIYYQVKENRKPSSELNGGKGITKLSPTSSIRSSFKRIISFRSCKNFDKDNSSPSDNKNGQSVDRKGSSFHMTNCIYNGISNINHRGRNGTKYHELEEYQKLWHSDLNLPSWYKRNKSKRSTTNDYYQRLHKSKERFFNKYQELTDTLFPFGRYSLKHYRMCLKSRRKKKWSSDKYQSYGDAIVTSAIDKQICSVTNLSDP